MTLAAPRDIAYRGSRIWCPKGLNREVRNGGSSAEPGTAPATVTGERIANMPLGASALEKAATSATIREVRKPA
jgi:hypothetical protein